MVLIELLTTLLFCLVLYKFGGCTVINGKFILLGLILWLIGYMEGIRKEKKNEQV